MTGDAGTGKSTLLKEIGKKSIERNKKSETKTLPIFIKSGVIYSNDFSIDKSIREILLNSFGEEDIEKIFSDYHILLLIDSIDEFEKSNQQKILKDLSFIISRDNINFILTTRNYETLTKECDICKHTNTYLSNFDQRQVKSYLDNFFRFDLVKSEKLWESLIDNHILERIPTTPLTISLVSILYEENGYEVPATLTDVYDNFNTFLLGRFNVKSRLDFLEISVKEKILSMYALKIIQTPNRVRLSSNEFLDYVVEFFKKKSININEELLPELLKSLTEGIGVLYINDKGLVSFKHDHFMEYYASREIFNQHNRHMLEQELIDNFTVFNWQNTAIFYAGRTKDMPEFLDYIIARVYKYNTLEDCLIAVSGLGYLLQSLWMTDSQIRKNGIIAALELLIKADTKVKELAETKFHFFKNIRDIDIAFMNLVWFYYHFNSIAIRDPLNLAFDELYTDLERFKNSLFDKDKVTRQYQLFCIAATLSTGRNMDDSKLNKLFDEDKILSNPFFVLLFENAVKIMELSSESRLIKNNKISNKIKKYSHGIRFYLNTPSEDLRFTTFEQLTPIKKIKLITEGKTDASIICHSFRVLTNCFDPYWNVTSVDNVNSKGGGAAELAKYIKSIAGNFDEKSDEDKIIIGIFDNDSKGFQEFNGLDADFKSINGIVKKHVKYNVYTMLLPIPIYDSYSPYYQDKQVFKFFEIEHYFNIEFLLKENMVKETSIRGVFEIVGDKNRFSDVVLKIIDENEFKNFTVLFREIDSICKKDIIYTD
ncbi:MAG: NACHT domain-containing NTPase [Bacteroidales bacterium]